MQEPVLCMFPLWELRTQQYIRAHEIPMYALLSVIVGANANLLKGYLQKRRSTTPARILPAWVSPFVEEYIAAQELPG